MNRTCSPGEYEIFVSVGLMDGTPVFELPYNDSDVSIRRNAPFTL